MQKLQITIILRINYKGYGNYPFFKEKQKDCITKTCFECRNAKTGCLTDIRVRFSGSNETSALDCSNLLFAKHARFRFFTDYDFKKLEFHKEGGIL